MATIEEKDVKNAKQLADAVIQASDAMHSFQESISSSIDAIRQMTQMMSRLTSSGIDNTVDNMAQRFKDMSDALDDMAENDPFADFTSGMEEATQASDSLSTRLHRTIDTAREMSTRGRKDVGTFDEAIRRLAKGGSIVETAFDMLTSSVNKGWLVAAGVATGAVTGLWQGFSNLVGLTKAAVGFFSSVVSSVFQVAAAIISIPIKILTGLVDLAANAELGGVELARAWEEVRKSFGRFTDESSKNVISTWKGMKQMNETGLSAWRVFGDLAAQMNHVREVAEAMGATWQLIGKEFAETNGRVLWFQKGLGLTNEQMKSYAQYATAYGRTLTDVFIEQTKYTEELGAAFGVSAKVLSKDVAGALSDVAHFAGATVEQMSKAAVFTRKLGIELKEITGLLDQFKTFDSAAESAAKLAQSFGANVDAFKLMEAQDPGTQLDMLRKSFAAAGVDAKKMTRQELELLSSTTGLDAGVARLAFSLDNQGLSMEEVNKKATEAKAKQLTQAEALSKLASSIERLVFEMQKMENSFVKMFIKGFLTGIQRSREFMTLMFKIKRALWETWRAGFELGIVFIKLVGPLNEVFEAFHDFFQPSKFKKLATGVADAIKDFFMMQTTGKHSFPELMKKLQQHFFDFFDSQKPAAMKMLSSYKKVLLLISNMTAEAMRWVAKEVVNGMKFLTELIKNPTAALSAASTGSSEFMKFIVELFTPLYDVIIEQAPLLWKALSELVVVSLSKLWNFVSTSPEIAKYGKYVMVGIAAVLFGPAIMQAALGGVTAMITGSFLSFAKQGGVMKILGRAAEMFSKNKTFVSATKQASDVTKAGAGLTEATSAAAKSTGSAAQFKSLFTKIVAVAAGLAVAGPMLALSMLVTYNILRSSELIQPANMFKFVIAFSGMILAFIEMTAATYLLTKIPKPNPADLAITAAVVVAVGALVAGLAYLSANMLSTIEPSKLLAASAMMTTMSLVMLAMIPLIAAATLIGAAIISTSGLALAPLAAGLAVISGVVVEMTKNVDILINNMKKHDLDSGTMKMLESYVSIMKVVSDMFSSLASVVKAMVPTFTELLLSGKQMRSARIDKSVEMVKMLGNTVVALVILVRDTIERLGGSGASEQTQQSANTFASVLSAVTSLMQATTPPPELFKAHISHTKAWTLLGGYETFSQSTYNLTEFFTLTRENVTQMLDKAMEMFNGIKSINMSDAELKAAPVIAKLLSAVVELLSAITPDPQTVAQFQRVHEEQAGLLSASTKIQQMDISSYQRYSQSIVSTFRMLMNTFFSAEFKETLKTVSTMNPDELKKLEIMGSILSTLGGVISAITNNLKGAVKIEKIEGKEAGFIENINVNIPSVAKTLEAIFDNGGALDMMFNKIVMLANMDFAKNIGPDWQKKIEQVNAVFKGLSSFNTIFSSLGSLISATKAQKIEGEGGAREWATGFIGSLKNLNWVLNTIFSSEEIGKHPIQEMFKLLDGFLQMPGVVDLTVRGDEMTKTLAGIATMTKDLNTSLTNMMLPNIQSTMEAVQKIIGTLEELDALLGKEIKVDIVASLNKFVENVGLNATKIKYSVKASPQLNMTLNVAVVVDADKLERVLLFRKESIIRDSIRYVRDKGAEAKSNDIPMATDAVYNKKVEN